MAPKRGLGRGLSNLIPTDDTIEDVSTKTPKQTKTSSAVKTELVKKVEQTLNINRIEPNKNQPRKEFNEDALQELADSIKQFGVIEPLVVVKRKGYYELIAGERRWRAARLAGLKEVPVVIKDYDDQQIVEIALIENIQREDLNPIEEAHAYERLIQEFNLTQDEVAERVSKSRTTVTNALRLLKLTEKVQQMLIDDMLSTGHVRALITITDPQLQYETAMYIFDKKLSVRETESYVKKLLNKKPKDKPAEKEDPELSFLYKAIENRLKESLGTKTTIKAKTKDSGKIEIEYYSQEDLERITQLLAQYKTKRGNFIMEEAKIFGMKMTSAVTILCILVVLLIILIIFIIHKMNIMVRKYEALMSGKKGADLEKIIRIRFKEMDQVKANARRVTKEHRRIKKHLSSCISKYALVKYDAFDKMAGKLSFVIALLNDDNSGILLNSMHSREGCFTYAKEIVNGESYIPLSAEEKEALEQAKTVEEEIQDMSKETEFEDSDGNLNFDA